MIPTLALAALIGVAPWAAVQDADAIPLPGPAPVQTTFDLGWVVKELMRLSELVARKADRGHMHGTESVLGLADMIRSMIEDGHFLRANGPNDVVGHTRFRGTLGVQFESSERMRVKLPLDGAPGPDFWIGIGIGTVQPTDYVTLGVTSPAYTVEGTHRFKSLEDRQAFIGLPNGYTFAIASYGATVPALKTTRTNGVEIPGKLKAGSIDGLITLYPVRFTVDRPAVGKDIAPGFTLPYPGRALKAVVRCKAPPKGGPATFDVKVDGQSLWGKFPGSEPSVAPGTTGGPTKSGPEVRTLPADAWVTLDCTAAGKDDPGQGYVVEVWFALRNPEGSQIP